MRIVLITGASEGLGKEFAHKYAQEGYNLLLVARSEYKLLAIKKELQDKYNIHVDIFVQDLSVRNAAKKLYEYTENKGYVVDILINNAGFGDFGDFIDSDLNKQEMMIDLNIVTLVQLSHFYLKNMIDNNSGKLLNIASIAGFMPGPKMSVYYATKAFVLSFTEAIAEELKDFDIQVSALCPGPTATNFEKNANVNFSSVKMYTSKDVVNYAYNKFMNSNRVIILPGLNNKVISITAKLAPRFLVRKAVNLIQTNFRTK